MNVALRIYTWRFVKFSFAIHYTIQKYHQAESRNLPVISTVIPTGNESCLLVFGMEYISTIQVTQMLNNIRRPLSSNHVMSAFAIHIWGALKRFPLTPDVAMCPPLALGTAMSAHKVQNVTNSILQVCLSITLSRYP